MKHTSEWVSLGHPDKIADCISSYILDRHLERDPDTRYAVEVQIKDNFVSLAGEITSKAGFGPSYLAKFAQDAVNKIGYTKAYQKKWGKENTICGDDLSIVCHVSRQSPDIARGVDENGWGDQGIFWGMAYNYEKTGYMPIDIWSAREIGTGLFRNPNLGLDVKTLVSIDDDDDIGVKCVIAAAPCIGLDDEIRTALGAKFGGCRVVFNGTGRFVRHGPIGDCGTTGRKLAVDFYGGNCRIGGGSPWTKDGTKADLTLNLYARYRALRFMREHGLPLVYCAISCCIGRPEIEVAFFDGRNEQLYSAEEKHTPAELIELFGLREPHFADLCANGLFSRMPD